jgi:hypothetical protein
MAQQRVLEPIESVPFNGLYVARQRERKKVRR